MITVENVTDEQLKQMSYTHCILTGVETCIDVNLFYKDEMKHPDVAFAPSQANPDEVEERLYVAIYSNGEEFGSGNDSYKSFDSVEDAVAECKKVFDAVLAESDKIPE